MMNELRNVLTVRATNKTVHKENRPRKARKSKHSKKKGEIQLTTTQTTDNLLTKNTQQTSDTISHDSSLQFDVDNLRNSDSTGHVLQGDIQDSVPCDTHSNTHCDILENRDMLLQDTDPLFMRQVATMVARMAIKQSTRSHQQEEVFGSNEDQ